MDGLRVEEGLALRTTAHARLGSARAVWESRRRFLSTTEFTLRTQLHAMYREWHNFACGAVSTCVMRAVRGACQKCFDLGERSGSVGSDSLALCSVSVFGYGRKITSTQSRSNRLSHLCRARARRWGEGDKFIVKSIPRVISLSAGWFAGAQLAVVRRSIGRPDPLSFYGSRPPAILPSFASVAAKTATPKRCEFRARSASRSFVRAMLDGGREGRRAAGDRSEL